MIAVWECDRQGVGIDSDPAIIVTAVTGLCDSAPAVGQCNRYMICLTADSTAPDNTRITFRLGVSDRSHHNQIAFIMSMRILGYLRVAVGPNCR